jgi:hypothetical protein
LCGHSATQVFDVLNQKWLTPHDLPTRRVVGLVGATNNREIGVMEMTRVLGVDLACRTWRDNGSALLEFGPDGWQACQVNVIRWPDGPLTADVMADAIDKYARATGVAAVCLDGPQGWREPGIGPTDRDGCGRWCEYETRTQGKTGEYGTTYPRNQYGWISFCIDVFALLAAQGHVQLVNDPDTMRLPPPKSGEYVILEVFPTSIWRVSGLNPLPGKRRTSEVQLRDYRCRLATRYGMPDGFISNGSHDDLQAVVAALAGVALLGGPAVPIPNGLPGRLVVASVAIPAHWVEGLIWDARPAQPGPILATVAEPPVPPVNGRGGNNPLIPDDRDEAGDESLERGVALFRHLVGEVRAGKAIGIRYDDFATYMHQAASYVELMGRNFAPSDINRVIDLADCVTEAAGGPLEVGRGTTQIRVGMDTFIWPMTPPYQLANRALAEHLRKYGYSGDEWESVFPSTTRRLLTLVEANQVTGG